MTVYESADQRGDLAFRRTSSVRVWDLPTRVMHWSLAAGIAICWWTGIHNELQYHLYGGYAVLWIALMRIYWGLVGSSTARFVNFVRGPRAIMEYVRTLHQRSSDYTHGHNALGAISVLVMLGLALGVVSLGLFAVDVDGLYSGPLSVYVDFHTGRHLAHRCGVAGYQGSEQGRKRDGEIGLVRVAGQLRRRRDLHRPFRAHPGVRGRRDERYLAKSH